MKRIGDLMTRDVLAVAPEDTLGEAAQKMVERGVGSAVVIATGANGKKSQLRLNYAVSPR